jgi:hypothetical protein
LAAWHVPVPHEKPFFPLWSNNLKSMLFIEANCPNCIGPGPDQHWAVGQLPQMRQEATADASLLAVSADIGVSNQSYILDLLNAHHALQRPILLVSPEHHAGLHFSAQFIPGHVWLTPAIRRDDAFIGVRAVVDDGPNQLKISFVTAADYT